MESGETHRENGFHKAESNRHMRELDVLMVIEGEIATTQLIERVLVACAPFGVRYRKRHLHSLRVQDFHRATIPLFVRCGDPALEIWIALLHRCRHPFVYYIDDNFWRIGGDSELARYYRHPRIRRSLEYAVSHAACILTNSEELAAFLGGFNPHTTVLPAFFDFSLIHGISPEPAGEIRIGFAGSPSRQNDLEIISPLVHPILESYPQAVFEFAGVKPRGIGEGERVRFFHHTSDYPAFVRFQATRGWSIGLAPLMDNESNRCKTNNKYREYGACRIAGIYSDLPPYRMSVAPGSTGVLVDNTTCAWLSALHYLMRNPQERIAMGIGAFEDVLEKHSVQGVAEEWAKSFNSIGAILTDHLQNSLPAAARWIWVKQLSLRFETMRMKVSTRYEEGGVFLVVRKSIEKIADAILSKSTGHKRS
jgi:glycosyltransferase involved in cell wall biosynthesis